MRRAGARLAVALGVLGAAACQKTSSDVAPAPARCQQVGQRCEVSPGKLGACVLRDGCPGGDCFVCQSQH